MTAGKFTCGSTGVMPKRPESRIWCARAAAAISALEGTQPWLRQSPPISPASIRVTLAPICAAPEATDSPAAPAPMTIRSLLVGLGVIAGSV